MAQQQANYFEGHLNWKWPLWKLAAFFDLTPICSSHLVSVTAGMIARLFWSAHRATACVSARSQRGSYLPSTSVRVLATPEIITPASYPTYADEGAHRTLDLLDEGV